ncbi:MAG: hypothetical protein R2747_24035 [Pyrinomonadaceae bacterium]
MKQKILLLSLCMIIFSIKAQAENGLELARRAVSDNPEEAAAAIRDLRAEGQTGLDRLLSFYAEDISRFRSTGEKGPEWEKISFAIDQVAMQKDAYASGLYWHTDLDEALKLSRETGKPILSLRLLGNLNEEFSCANSRFFRAVLYSNQQISAILKDRFILHWKSVRPAPRITVDFGDGRKIERTVTGNSIHYVLDDTGMVVDGLPGLYSPQKFYRFLATSSGWVGSARKLETGAWKPPTLSPEIKNKRLAFYQDMRYVEYNGLRNRLNNAIFRAFGKGKIKFDTRLKPAHEFEEMPTALEVAPRAISKMATELVYVRDLTPDVTRYGADQIDLEKWKRIAALYGSEHKLDDNSLGFIRTQLKRNGLREEDFSKLIANFQILIGVDSVRNDFLLRPTLLTWLNKEPTRDVEKLNQKVYDELFLTPGRDEWLGLYSSDVYTALDGNGVSR